MDTSLRFRPYYGIYARSRTVSLDLILISLNGDGNTVTNAELRANYADGRSATFGGNNGRITEIAPGFIAWIANNPSGRQLVCRHRGYWVSKPRRYYPP